MPLPNPSILLGGWSEDHCIRFPLLRTLTPISGVLVFFTAADQIETLQPTTMNATANRVPPSPATPMARTLVASVKEKVAVKTTSQPLISRKRKGKKKQEVRLKEIALRCMSFWVLSCSWWLAIALAISDQIRRSFQSVPTCTILIGIVWFPWHTNTRNKLTLFFACYLTTTTLLLHRLVLPGKTQESLICVQLLFQARKEAYSWQTRTLSVR